MEDRKKKEGTGCWSWMREGEVNYPKEDEWLLANVSALFSRGSGHKSKGHWPFLLQIWRSAPFDAGHRILEHNVNTFSWSKRFLPKKQAMEALLFFSAPSLPNPIKSCGAKEIVKHSEELFHFDSHSKPIYFSLTLPTSWTSWSCRSWESVWWRSASWRGVSPSLSWMFRLAPSLTRSRTICVCCRSTARWIGVWRFTFWRSSEPFPWWTKSSATSMWLFKAAKCNAVYPSSFFSSTIQLRGNLLKSIRIALHF